MKRLLFGVAISLTVLSSFAKDGYRIQLKMKDVKDTTVFLCHYYGIANPYKKDSAKLVNGVAEFVSHDSLFAGGIYMVFLPGKNTTFDFLLNNGDNITVTADAATLPEGVVFKNSPENTRFENYVDFLAHYSDGQKALQQQLEHANSLADTEAVRKKSAVLAKELDEYRMDYTRNYPGTLLSNIFSAMKLPEIPSGDHFLDDGKTKDSTFTYKYYKAHFWDGFNFQDDRLVYTPLFDARLDEYFNKLVLPWPDSVEHEADVLLAKARGTRDIFKYTLWWITRNVENSKVMGMDEAFVYLVENYYMKGDAFWLKPEELQKYVDRIQKIAPNVLGHIAPQVKLPDLFTAKDDKLSDIASPYTLLLFYSPNCGHCQHEIPLIDSVYNAALKEKGVKIFTVSTEGDEKQNTDFVKKQHMDKWGGANTWDPKNVGNFRSMYDVYSTPTLYILDKNKIIRGKRLDHTNIMNVIQMEERKARDRLLKK